MKIDKRQPEW
jgi:hypothetical protein